MDVSLIRNLLIDEILDSPAGQVLCKAMQTLEAVQRNLYALAVSEDSGKLQMLKIGTVFQIFLIDTLASGKRPGELDREDWARIAENVSRYAILSSGQAYSEFVFTLYADYIDISAEVLGAAVPESMSASIDEIAALSAEIRGKTEQLQNGELAEAAYIEDCLWLSLEAMIKLLAAFLSMKLIPLLGEDHAKLAQVLPQLAFEYGRYVLYAKERQILDEYLDNQRILDERLQERYSQYLSELQQQAERFTKLVDAAFSADLRDALQRSAALAREVGAADCELLTSVEDVDAFFLD